MATYTPPDNDTLDFQVQAGYTPPDNDALDFQMVTGDVVVKVFAVFEESCVLATKNVNTVSLDWNFFDYPIVTWDPDNKGDHLSLSNYNLTATKEGVLAGYEVARATECKDFGRLNSKWYFEIKCDYMGGLSYYTRFGIANSQQDLDTAPIGDYGWSLGGNQVWHGSTGIVTVPAHDFITGAIIGVAFDLDTGEIWFAVDNVWVTTVAITTSDPATGVGAMFSDVYGDHIFACVAMREGEDDPSGNGTIVTGAFYSDSGQLTYTPPTGFTPYGVGLPPLAYGVTEEPWRLLDYVYRFVEEPWTIFTPNSATIEEEWYIAFHALSTVEEIWELVGPLYKVIEEIYTLSTEPKNIIVEEWVLVEPIIGLFVETYGLKMVKEMIEWYGDAPIPKAIINEYYADSPILVRTIFERYDNALAPLRNFIELYGDKPFAVDFISVLYGDAPVHKGVYYEPYNDAVVATVLKTLIYGDKPSANKVYNEYYGDAKVLLKSVDQKYQDSLKAYNRITETYNFNTGAQLIINQSWGIAGTGIVKTFEEAYELDILNPVSSTFDMSYYLVSESAIENAVEVTITVNEIPIDFISVDIEAGMDKYVIVGKVEVATEADYINSPLDGDVECIIDGVTFNLFIETRGKSKTNAGGINWTIDMLSPTAKLDSPYSKTMVETFTNNILASELVQQMADYQGITVDWDLPLDVFGDPIDWNIPNYAISANDETPLAVIKKVVNAIGAIIQTKPNGDMLIISRYPISPTEWNLTVPSVIFSSETDIVSITDSIVINEGLNAFLITDQGSSAANITLEEIEINNTTKIIRGFRIPFDEGAFNLVTSGGPLISVVKDSNYIEANLPEDFNEDEEWEYVEFIDWVGTTSYPIYEIIESQWVTENMGSFTPSENGTLTVDTQNDNLKESLLRIKYKTKYWKWTVKGPVGAYAQVYVPELETT